MKIKKIILDNFRCFKHLELNFTEMVTVLVAANGQGKTAILEAITYLLGIMIGRFPQISVPKLKASDFRNEWTQTDELNLQTEKNWKPVKKEPFMRIHGEDDNGHQWDSTFKRDSSSKTLKRIPPGLGGKAIIALADEYINMANNEGPLTKFFPVFAYYDTGRAVIRNKPERKRNFQNSFNRYDGYKDALTGHLNYKKMIEWLFFLEYNQLKGGKLHRDWNYQTIEQKTIQLAIEKMLPGFKNLRIHTKPLDLIIDVEEGESFKSCCIDSQLSDGYKIVLVLVLDLISRILELNSNIQGATPEKLLQVPGIVLIDEVDLHLHPSWQQRIILDLQRTFPQIQFIVTTHSPQVVSYVAKECVRLIDQGQIIPLNTPTQGVEIRDILSGIFGTEEIPQNTEIARKLNLLHSWLSEGKGNTKEWEHLYHELEVYYGENYPPLLGTLEHKKFLEKMTEQ